MRRLDRRDVITVIDPEPPGGLPKDFGHEIAIGAATIQVIMTCPHVIETRGNAAHGRGLAFRDCVLGKRRIDADMHVGVDTAREGEMVPAIESLSGLIGLQVGCELADLAVLDADIEAVDRCFFWTHDTDIFDYKVEWFRHAVPLIP